MESAPGACKFGCPLENYPPQKTACPSEQKVRIRVKLNTPGKADGEFAVHVDGKQVNQQSGVEFRARDGKGTLISRMLFSTFHGGNSPGHAPKDKKGNFITVHADFDNFLVTEGS